VPVRTIAAEPAPLDVDTGRTALVIMTCKGIFWKPGGFGAALGNDVSLLKQPSARAAQVLAAARGSGILVIHTREGHRPT